MSNFPLLQNSLNKICFLLLYFFFISYREFRNKNSFFVVFAETIQLYYDQKKKLYCSLSPFGRFNITKKKLLLLISFRYIFYIQFLFSIQPNYFHFFFCMRFPFWYVERWKWRSNNNKKIYIIGKKKLKVTKKKFMCILCKCILLSLLNIFFW